MAKQIKPKSLADVAVAALQRRDHEDQVMGFAYHEFSRGEQIRFYRKMNKLTQGELATKAGVNPETIVRLERGGNVRLDTWERVRSALFGKPSPSELEEEGHEEVSVTLSEAHLLKAYRALDAKAQAVALGLLERGEVGSPSVADANSNRDLPRHAPDQVSDLLKGRSDVPASAAPVGVPQQYEALVRALQDVTRIATNAVATTKPTPVPKKNTRARKSESAVRSRARGSRR